MFDYSRSDFGFNEFLGDFIQEKVDEYNAIQGERYVEQQQQYETVYFKEFNQLLLDGHEAKAAQEAARAKVINQFNLTEYRIPEVIEHDLF